MRNIFEPKDPSKKVKGREREREREPEREKVFIKWNSKSNIKTNYNSPE